jgi:TRAP-type C4-dicarboxylate transport system permease small subunit
VLCTSEFKFHFAAHVIAMAYREAEHFRSNTLRAAAQREPNKTCVATALLLLLVATALLLLLMAKALYCYFWQNHYYCYLWKLNNFGYF